MRIQSATFCMLALATAFSAFAAPISISTGVAPWTVNSNPAVVESPIATPFWINNFGDGSWVGPSANSGNLVSPPDAPGTYTYSLNIGALLAGGTFSLDYAADNDVTWSITNGSLGGTTSCLTDTCFSAVGGAPRALTGVIDNASAVLTATVVNSGRVATPVGLLAVGTADSVPEPSTFAMIGLGGAALLFSRLRRK